MKRKPMKKLFAALAMTVTLLVAATISASACTTIYVGGNLVEEGTPFVARTEDYGSDMNKMWFISEAGAFKEGDKWLGCPEYGEFEWTFTHDSYRFTYFTNDIFNGTCPECGQEDPTHWSYTEFGTNDHGVSVSATETISGNSAVKQVDPNVRTKVDGIVGIEETDIPTIILAEAASAREGIELLAEIYDTHGAFFDSGIFVCDKDEVWYIENCSGTQYVAVKLNNDMIFLEPNIAVIGEIDLDDENVIASERLIEVAQEAGTFVGDADEHIIDYRASYANLGTESSPRVGTPRMADGLKFLNADYDYTPADLYADNTKFTISNLKDGEIVPMYTNIEADRQLTKDDVFNFYKLSSVGKPSNQEIEIFQLFQDPELETEYSTVGWVGVGNMSNNVFVPYYPMLIDDMYEAYQVSTSVVTQTAEKPDSFCTWNARSGKYVVYPENWQDSYYFCFEGLGGYILYAEQIDGAPLSDSTKQYVLDRLSDLQHEFYDELVTVEELKESDDARALATENGMAMAEKAHKLAIELINEIVPPRSYEELAQRMDYDQAMADAQYLVEEIGTRLTGTQSERAALDYLEEQYAKLGYEIERQDFTLDTRTCGDIYVGEDYILAAGTPSKNDGFTGFGTATGTSVYLADPADAANLDDLTGKIVFFPGNFRTVRGADSTYTPVSPATYEAVEILGAKNAAGIVVMMAPETEETERYQIRVSTPNFATAGLVDAPVATPVLVVNAMDAEKLTAYFGEHSDVEITMDVHDHVDSQNLIVTKKAAVDTDLTLYVTCHIDSVLPSPGANDNASGVVGVLTMARAFQNLETNYNIKFISFGAEEVGLQGARYFAANLTEEEIANAIGNYNLDMVATSQADCTYIFMNSSTTPETGYDTPVNDPALETHVTRQAREAAKALGFDMDHYRTCFDRTTDHYALHLVGIPAVEFDWRANEEGTSFEAYYHTRFDDFEHNFSKDKLKTQVDIIALAVYNEATSDYCAVTGEGVYRAYHDTLADAIAAVEDGGTVKLLRDCGETISVAREVSFTLDANGNQFTGSITSASGYRLNCADNIYTITLKSYSGSSSGSSSSGSGSTPTVPEKWGNPFVDVKGGDWYYDAVEYTVEKGLLSGMSTNIFAPDTELSRAMVVQILYSMEGKPAVTGSSPFADVAEDAWYADAVKWAASQGIVDGVGDGRFAPEAQVTREQLALILFGYAGSPDAPAQDLTGFADAGQVSAWSADALRWAVGSNIISGKTGNVLNAQGTATRAEVAQMIMKFDSAQA